MNMNANSVRYISKKDENLLNDLKTLLEKQIEMAHKGDIKGLESLGKQTNSLIEKCAQSGILDRADFENQRVNLKKLYEQLSMALSAQRAEASEQLSRIRKGRRTLHVYRGGI